MALDRVSFPDGVTGAAGDRANFVALLVQLTQKWNGDPQKFSSDIVPQGAMIQIGGVIYKGTSDTAITGSASSYVKITPSGATASASYVSSLSGVTWNPSYNGYYDGSGNLYISPELMPYGKKTFLATGTWLVPHDVTEMWVSGTASGGNGGAGAVGISLTRGGGGGGGGDRGKHVNKKRIVVIPGEILTITIGSIGNNTTISGSGSGSVLTLGFGANGNAGGSTTGGAYGIGGGGGGGNSTATGGGNGTAGLITFVPYSGVGGAGGVASGGCGGGGGGGCQGFFDTTTGAGNGGAGGGTGGGGNGTAATSFGGGGGGGGGGDSVVVTAGTGGNGGPAIIIIEW